MGNATCLNVVNVAKKRVCVAIRGLAAVAQPNYQNKRRLLARFGQFLITDAGLALERIALFSGYVVDALWDFLSLFELYVQSRQPPFLTCMIHSCFEFLFGNGIIEAGNYQCSFAGKMPGDASPACRIHP